LLRRGIKKKHAKAIQEQKSSVEDGDVELQKALELSKKEHELSLQRMKSDSEREEYEVCTTANAIILKKTL